MTHLPLIDACLNFLSFIFLVQGYRYIKQKNEIMHKKCMISALVTSGLFLAVYLFYHYHVGSVKFPELGWIKTVYLIILIPHIILAVVMLPFIFLTFYHAFKDHRELHKKWARITFPIWVYVSLSGVTVYLMLYHMAPLLIE
jgi:uncharacterized membrane protein YozB (DUF420 family)